MEDTGEGIQGIYRKRPRRGNGKGALKKCFKLIVTQNRFKITVLEDIP